jgi:hypothetical protein
LAVTLPRAVRRSLGLYEGFAGVESLHERGDYEPWYYDDWEWRCNRYVRARAQRSWQREIVSDMLSPEHETETERTHPRRCRRRPVTQCGSRRGRAHDWSEYVAREIYWASSQAYEQRSCRRCHAVQKRNLTHEELVRQHAQRDHWSMESILARLYGGRKGE